MTSPISLFACFAGAIETYDYTLAAGSLTANLYRCVVNLVSIEDVLPQRVADDRFGKTFS